MAKKRKKTMKKKTVKATPYQALYTPEYPKVSQMIARNQDGILSLISGIVGVVFPFLIFPQILALVFGYRQRKIHSDASATAGLILGWIGIALVLIAVIGAIILAAFGLSWVNLVNYFIS